MENNLTWAEFEKVAMFVGTIINVNDFPEARKPAYQLTIDFGEVIGIKKTSAQITKRYSNRSTFKPTDCCGCEFPKKANWKIHERMSGFRSGRTGRRCYPISSRFQN